jgi:hypothetical protein
MQWFMDSPGLDGARLYANNVPPHMVLRERS